MEVVYKASSETDKAVEKVLDIVSSMSPSDAVDALERSLSVVKDAKQTYDRSLTGY